MYKYRTDGKGGIVTGTLYIPALNQEKFWKAVMRGGIQAAVYVSDTIEKLGK